MPFIEPMLAVSGKKDLDYYETSAIPYIAEPKLDGIRVIVELDSSGDVKIYSRTGKDLSKKFPQIVNEFLYGEMSHIEPGTILDGEIVAVKDIRYGGRGGLVALPVTDFEGIQSVVNSLPHRAVTEGAKHNIKLYVFDVLAMGGTDVTMLSYGHRTSYLGTLMHPYFSKPYPDRELNTVCCLSISADGFQTLYDDYLAAGGEGVIVKNIDAPYYAGKRRANTFIKFKAEETYDVFITGFKPGEGKYEGTLGALSFSVFNDGMLHHVGYCGGMSDKLRQDIWDDQYSYVMKPIEIKANGLVGSGKFLSPRHPSFIRFRTDKAAIDCSVSQFKNPDYKEPE